MDRLMVSQLMEWKNSLIRKPLLLRGATQVGKSRVLKKFGQDFFENCIYEDLTDNTGMRDFFQSKPTAEDIICFVKSVSKAEVEKEKTLIIFDGIEEVPEIILALKELYEEAPKYYIMAISCVMGIDIYDSTFVQNFVQIETLYPLNFYEFVRFMEPENTECTTFLLNGEYGENTKLHNKCIELLKIYLRVGGMPKVVMAYKETGCIEAAELEQQKILNEWAYDLRENSPRRFRFKARKVWKSAAEQLTKENKKFMYKDVSPDARGKTYIGAMEWLEECGMLHRIYREKWYTSPPSTKIDFNCFKAYFVDVGLLSMMLKFRPELCKNKSEIFEWKNRVLTEQFVCQELISHEKNKPCYWASENSIGQVDFLVRGKRGIVAIEVQAKENRQAKKLKAYKEKHGEIEAVRVSTGEYKAYESFSNVPLYGIRQLFCDD